MGVHDMNTSLNCEIMLQVNQKLYHGGLISRQLYEAAKAQIVQIK